MFKRTTITLDEDIVRAARSLAAAKSISLGHAVSALARRGIAGPPPTVEEDRFPVFHVSRGAYCVTIEDIRGAEDDL